MKTATLKLETLHLIPGLAEDFDRQVEQLVADCKQRPGLAKPRKLKLELDVEPHADDADDVWVRPVISTRRPATQIDPVRGRRTRAGQLQFDFSEDGPYEDGKSRGAGG